MPMHFDSVDEAIEALGEKVIQAEGGPYIRVSDLAKLNEDYGKARAARKERETAERVGTFAAATERAKHDPEFRKLFEAKPPSAPAVARDSGVAEKETDDVAAPAA